MKKILLITSLCLVLFLGLFFWGRSQSPKNIIVGDWKYEVSDEELGIKDVKALSFTKGGNGEYVHVVTDEDGERAYKGDFEWEIDDKTLYLKHIWFNGRYPDDCQIPIFFSSDKNTLFIDYEGRTYDYQRMDKPITTLYDVYNVNRIE